jgi:arginyl-tRNA synthetase
MLTATNLFDYFEETPQEGEQALWAARPPLRPQAGCDLKLMPRSPGWQEDPEAVSALERIESEPWVAGVTRRESSVDVLLDDDWIETVGQALLDGDAREDTLSDLASECRFTVQFWDANATKALHAGHLRNLALGNSIAAALEQAGADVERRSLISDVGRAMGEAMAGVVGSGQHVHLWPSGNEKSDHFVGECYAGYVKSGSAMAAGTEEDSLTRELTMRGDEADTWIKRVLAGDREALDLWSKTRAWAIGGQRKTLALLGIAFDRVIFESDFLPEMLQLTEQGVREGRFLRRDDGVIYYPTGHEDFDELPLVRGDGVPTQHMRALAYWLEAPDMDERNTMQVCGIEWVSHVTYRRQLMAELMAAAPPVQREQEMHPTQDIFHGMVARQKRAFSSSQEGALLIDQLIEALDAQMEAHPEGRIVRRTHPHPDRTAPQVALGFFLTKPSTPEVDFDPEGLLVARGSPGFDLVRARARAAGGGKPSELAPAQEPDFRFAVVQSEVYRRHLRLAVERLDVGPLARHVDHLARWFTERDRSEHASRAVATLLDRGARGLGLERR